MGAGSVFYDTRVWVETTGEKIISEQFYEYHFPDN